MNIDWDKTLLSCAILYVDAHFITLKSQLLLLFPILLFWISPFLLQMNADMLSTTKNKRSWSTSSKHGDILILQDVINWQFCNRILKIEAEKLLPSIFCWIKLVFMNNMWKVWSLYSVSKCSRKISLNRIWLSCIPNPHESCSTCLKDQFSIHTYRPNYCEGEDIYLRKAKRL